MPRIAPVPADAATPDEVEAVAAIHAAWGAVPTLGLVIARSRPLTQAVLAFGRELHSGHFKGAFAEQLAIAVANENRCAYCLAAHTAAGRAYGLDDRALDEARIGRASDAKVDAALSFAQTVARERGHVTDDELDKARAAGWTDSDLVEIVGHVIGVTLTNYLHHLSDVPVDFPGVAFAPATRSDKAA